MNYYRVTRADCLIFATKDVEDRLNSITDMSILKALALLWCAMNGYRLGGYLGGDCWDATEIKNKFGETETRGEEALEKQGIKVE